MTLQYSPKSNPRVIVIQKLYGKFFNKDEMTLIRSFSPEEVYIPNDIYLDNNKQQIIIITGPNMSGKSALIRQTALIVILAQIGCFVPADSALIGIVDKLFTRYKSKKEVVKEEIPKEEVSVKEKRIGRGAVVSEKK